MHDFWMITLINIIITVHLSCVLSLIQMSLYMFRNLYAACSNLTNILKLRNPYLKWQY